MAKYSVVLRYKEPISALEAMKTLPEEAMVQKKNKDTDVTVVLLEIELADNAKPAGINLVAQETKAAS